MFFNSWVVRKGEPRKLVSVRRTVHRYHPVLHSAVEQELEAVDETGERYHFRGEALAQTPMHSWPNIAFRDSVFRWTDLMDGTNRVTYCTYQEICYDAYIRGPATSADKYVVALDNCATATTVQPTVGEFSRSPNPRVTHKPPQRVPGWKASPHTE